MTMSCKQIQYGTAQMATKEKGEKGGEEKQTMVALLVFKWLLWRFLAEKQNVGQKRSIWR